jgi:hypothetical protein
MKFEKCLLPFNRIFCILPKEVKMYIYKNLPVSSMGVKLGLLILGKEYRFKEYEKKSAGAICECK